MSENDAVTQPFAEDTSLAIEDVQATLAKNLSLARSVGNFTQGQLAELAGVSRATIVQLESGQGDPRLSTVIQLAAALGTSPLLLLLGKRELEAFASALSDDSGRRALVDADDVSVMRRLLGTGIDRNREKAVRLGIAAASTAGLAAGGAAMGAAIGTTLLPGVGTIVGAVMGSWLGKQAIKGRKP